MIHGSVLPSISIINKTKYELEESSITKKNNIKIGCLSRLGIVHDSHKTFASFTALMYVNNLCQIPINITDFCVYTQWKIRLDLTPLAKVMLTPKNYLLLTLQ